MKDWNYCTWGDISELKYGKSIKGYKEKVGKYQVFGTNGPIGFWDDYLYDLEGIIVGRKGAYRGIHYSDQPFYVIDTAYYLLPKTPDLHVKFGYYQLLTLDLNSYDSGSAIPSTSKADFYSLPIHLPPIQEQKRIECFLSNLDRKISILRSQNKILEEMAQAIFKHWFVDFEFPISADYAASSGMPELEGKPYRSSGGRMVDADWENGEIPEGWEVKCLKDLSLEISRGIAPKYSEIQGLMTVNQRCIRNKSIDFSFTRRHKANKEVPENKVIALGDVLINSTGVGTLGRTAIVKRIPESEVTVDTHVTIVRPDQDKLLSGCLGLNLTCREKEIEYIGEGSTGQTELSRTNLGNLELVIPSFDQQKKFQKITIGIHRKQAINENQIITLTELRDTLLPKLMSGGIRV